MPIATQMVGDIEGLAGHPVLLPEQFGPGSPTTPGHSAEPAAAIAVFEGETQMTVGEDARNCEQTCAARDEDGILIAEAKRRKLFERDEELGRDLGEAKFEVEV